MLPLNRCMIPGVKWKIILNSRAILQDGYENQMW